MEDVHVCIIVVSEEISKKITLIKQNVAVKK